jgi:hypothetical protein
MRGMHRRCVTKSHFRDIHSFGFFIVAICFYFWYKRENTICAQLLVGRFFPPKADPLRAEEKNKMYNEDEELMEEKSFKINDDPEDDLSEDIDDPLDPIEEPDFGIGTEEPETELE